jgi:catechol 2,3-dioxygenase-like lactoylglutathione lyase family enzyme
MANITGINHIALQVKNAARTAEFYGKYCGMKVIHLRQEGELNVQWIRHPNQPDGFMLVLIESLGEPSQDSGNMNHIGFYVENRQDVDEIAKLAETHGVLVEGPVYAGPIVGYYCMILDPDGNLVEFSCEQAQA